MRLRYRRDPAGRTWVLALMAGLVLVLAILVFAAGCGGTGAAATTTTSTASAAGGQVVIKGFAFNPGSITIKAGESVTWANQDGSTHTVTADNGEFSSSNVAAGDKYTFKFDKAGTYPYHCSIHSTMKGTVVVQ